MADSGIEENNSRTNVEHNKLPPFDGEVITPDNKDYFSYCYQYASSSHQDITKPAVIIMAKNESDVIKAIEYAKSKGIAVAVRTGGHQYSGASSTYNKNIQLDLSQTYKNFKWENENYTLVTFGISYTVGEINEKLREKNRFVPHGQCQYVGMGGHVQTGGYGQLARSFGLLSDHVEKFRIITSDCKERWVYYNVPEDKELFFAVLGGSPGNFGIITDVTLRVFRDEDYPNSRGLRAIYPYNSKILKDLLDIMVEMAGVEEFPADYDYCVTVLSESEFTTYEYTYDMMYRKKGQVNVAWPPMIAVFVQWANLQGSKQPYDSGFISKIKKVAEKDEKRRIIVDDDKYTPMSVLTSHWIVPIAREFDFPYIKHTYSSNSESKRLKKFKWTDWVTNRIENGQKLGLKLVAQFQHFGGSNSRFFRNGIYRNNNPTSFSWRDTHLGYTMDAFYHSYQHDDAKKWVQKNDEEGVGNKKAKFCKDDRRVLWGSYDLDLHANQKYYYDQRPEGKYEQLCKTKKKYDPSGVFTPNKFCVGGLEEKSAEDKFWGMVSMAREVDTKTVPLWDFWRV